MSLRKLLLCIAVLLSLNLLVHGTSNNETIPITIILWNKLDTTFNGNISKENITNIIRLKNGTEDRFPLNSRLGTKEPRRRIVKRSTYDDRSHRRHRQLEVRVCPRHIVPLNNITKERLLGVWYAYATTPLKISQYVRPCSTYNVRNNPYFYTNIIYTDYTHLCITYSCLPNKQNGMYTIKLRVLTRTRIPMARTLRTIRDFLDKIRFSYNYLDWLKTEAFCFEWYQLNFELYPRPGRYLAPWNQDIEH